MILIKRIRLNEAKEKRKYIYNIDEIDLEEKTHKCIDRVIHQLT